jgi:hypothetical protein
MTFPQLGERVALYSHGMFRRDVRYAVVERMTATQIVLDNGDRYRIKDLRKVGEDYYRSPTMLPANHPDVLGVEARMLVEKVRREMEKALAVTVTSPESADRLFSEAIAILERAAVAACKL